MSEDPLARFTPDNVASALRGFYTPPKPVGALIEREQLIELLGNLPSMSPDEHVDPILVQIERHHRGSSFNPADHAALAFVDDAVTQILRQTDLDFKVEAFVRSFAPHLAAIAVRDGVTATTRPGPLLSLIDLLTHECVGWSEDLGILGVQFMEKLEGILRPLISGKSDADACYKALRSFFAKEAPIFESMEQRLRETEHTVLVGQKAKYCAAQLLNRQMVGKPLPIFIIFMLQGSWYQFLQDVYIAYGQKSEEWQNAARLSETLIWTLQPQSDSDKQKSLMASVPNEIKQFCSGMRFNTRQVEACLADVEAEYELINAGTPSEPCDFEPLEVDRSMADNNKHIDAAMLKNIEDYEAGQWFLYDDPDEPEEKVARIKLILNWRDTERLLFTNHNRRKVLHMSYGEMATHLANRSVTLLTPRGDAHTIIHDHLITVIYGVQKQKKKEIQIEAVEQRKEVSHEYLVRRKRALIKALEQHKQQAEVKYKRAMILRQKATQKLAAATNAVKSLKVEAWMKLPVMEGTLTPCRLVAVIPGADKYIFANRAGIKVAEYTGGQLSNMIVTENSEILDTGEEFANVLASVVTGLREDRNKSYDELTGKSA